MDRNELISKANEALAEEFEIEIAEIAPDANIKETLDLDSLGLVDMVALIEGLFGVKIQAQEIVTIVTFDDLYDFVHARLTK
ncbi:MAG: phosphopantetheine-binding protein [Prevotellaceae bacterium]|jgi:acyl carrier protein|nr:phosphopantetheine-binding protein [Prevotellaceae bacterium]